MRLYKRHDVDLICLYEQSHPALKKAIKKAVIAYLDESDRKISFSDCESDLSELPSTAQFHLYLSPKSEEDIRIINCIKKIPPGFKNSFLKNITRYYLDSPSVFSFVNHKIKLH